MLSAKPWKPDAVIRLLLSVFLCICASYLGLAVIHYINGHGKAGAKFYPVAAGAFGFLVATLVLLRQPWDLEKFMKHAAAFLICVYASLILGFWALHMAWPTQPDTPTPGQMLFMLLGFQGATLVWVTLFLREHKLTWAEGFGFRNERLRAVLVGLLAASLFLPVGSRLQSASGDGLIWASKKLSHYFPNLNANPYKPEEQTAVQTLRDTFSWVDRTFLGIAVILLVPVAEELLFRGVIYPWIKRMGFPHLALFGSSILFAAMHFSAVTFLPLFLLALILIALYEWTDNLLAPITAHALFNGLNFVVLYASDHQLLPK